MPKAVFRPTWTPTDSRVKQQAKVLQLVGGAIRHGTVDLKLAEALGWAVEDTEEFVFLHPKEAAVDYMAFRKGDSNPYIIQIPHARTEMHLMKIAPELFMQLNARGIWMTTAVKRSALDTAHEFMCDLSMATVAAARANPELVFLSLHGFAASEKNLLYGVDVIVSSGTIWPSARALTIHKELKKLYRGKRVLLFPWHTWNLGGTTNTQGQLLRDGHTAEAFVHVELSLAFREKLKDDVTALTAFSDALGRGLQSPPDKETLRLSDPWALSVGAQLRRKLSGRDMLRIALNVTEEAFDSEWKGHPAKIAEQLGVTPEEVRFYLRL